MKFREFQRYFYQSVANKFSKSGLAQIIGLININSATVSEDHLTTLFKILRYAGQSAISSHTEYILLDLFQKTFVDGKSVDFFEVYEGENLQVDLSVPDDAIWAGYWLVAVDDETNTYLTALDIPALNGADDVETGQSTQYVEMDDIAKTSSSYFIKARVQLEKGDDGANGEAVRIVYEFYIGLKQKNIDQD
jgi:hypothetical protein